MIQRAVFWTVSCQRTEVLSYAVAAVVVMAPGAAFVETVALGSAEQAIEQVIDRGAAVAAALIIDIFAVAEPVELEVDTAETGTAEVGIDRRHSPSCDC